MAKRRVVTRKKPAARKQRTATARKPRPTAERTSLPLFTRPQLAVIFRKDPRTIAKWLEEGLPVAARGRGGRASKYRLPDVVAWVLEREVQAKEAGASAEGAMSPQQERALLDRRKREDLEFRMRIRRGQYVEIAAVQAEYGDVAQAVKARLRAIPNAVADQVAAAAALGPAPVKALLQSKIDEALRELARGAVLEEAPAPEERADAQPAIAAEEVPA
jgi:phage terminase Nu1 subunit (DNA packaging protein)